MPRINGKSPVERRKRGNFLASSASSSAALLPNSILVRFLLYSVAFSILSIPFVLHISLSGECGTALDQSLVNNVPPRIRSLEQFGRKGKQQQLQQQQQQSYSYSNSNSLPVVRYSLDHPPPTTTMSPYTIIHTISTRFMVGQPSGYTLARARYLLFETFCWPTILHQTNHNFYWIVLVDPRLDQQILNDMRALLQKMPFQNAFMVMTSNTEWAADGVGVENVTSYGVGLRTIAQEYQRGTVDIVTGNTTQLLRALDWMDGKIDKGKTILTIETLLDADDGLNNQGIDWIQQTALQRLREQQLYFASSWSTIEKSSHRSSLEGTWWFLCGTDHIEWHNRDIFRIAPEDYSITGITSGLTGVRREPFFCTSAGFTRIGLTLPPSNMTFPKDAYSNHALAFYFPRCTNADQLSTTPTINISMAHCWRREFPRQPFILKSRSISSDSMDNMHPRDRDYRDVPWVSAADHPLLLNETDKTWELLTQDFSISRRAAWSTSVYLYEHRQQILTENKASRCSPGFPCYKAAKKNMVLMERYWMRQEADPGNKTITGTFRGMMALQKEQKKKSFMQQHNITDSSDVNYTHLINEMTQKYLSQHVQHDADGEKYDNGDTRVKKEEKTM